MPRFSRLTSYSPVFFALLFGWLGTGYYFRVDLSQLAGCIGYPENHLDGYRTFFAILSTALLAAAWLLTGIAPKRRLVLLELLFWLGLLFLVKGGDAVGYGGVPQNELVLYDFAGLLLRFALLNSIGNEKWLTSRFSSPLPAKVVMVLLAVAALYIKINYLPFPLIFLGFPSTLT